MTDKYCTLLFLKKEDKILLAMKKRGFGSGKYNGVGGKIEPTETLEQALARECKEEINVTPMHYWKVAEHDFIMDSDTKSPWHMYVHAYFCDEWMGEPTETDEMAPEWFEVKDIPYAEMWQDDEYWLPHVLAGQKVFGSYYFDSKDQLIRHHVHMGDDLPGAIPTKA